MLLNDISLQQLRIFEAVVRTQNMTQAAKQLFLTQSGVSQHMKALEVVLATKLFDRIQGRVIPTSQGRDFYAKVCSILEELEKTLEVFSNQTKMLTGQLVIGMPSEFGLQVVLPWVSRFCKENPQVNIMMQSETPLMMSDLLLSGEMDFAFVDHVRLDRRIITEPVQDEVLDLCFRADLKTDLTKCDFIDYDRQGSILDLWFKHHLGRSIDQESRRIRAVLKEPQGVASLILDGLGAGILPDHLLHRLIKEGAPLKSFRLAKTPLRHQISLAWLKERSLSETSRAAMNWLRMGLSGGLPHGDSTTKKTFISRSQSH